MKSRIWIVCVLVAVLLSLTVWAQLIARHERQSEKSGFSAKGDPSTARKVTLTYDGVERYYLVQPVASSGLHPVVVLLHGGTQDAKKVWRQTSLPTLGLQQNFIVVAPNAIDGRWDDGRSAVIGGRPSTANDVGFLRLVIADVLRSQHGDPKAVFMVGVSNGGFMTMRFACEAGSLLHAAGNVISDLPIALQQTCHAPPMPWFSMNGTSDPLIPFEGMTTGTKKFGRDLPPLLSADATFQFWSARDKCGPISAGTRLPHLNDSDPTWAEKRVCTGIGGRQSAQYVFHGAGHNWPNARNGPLVRAILGDSNQDVDAGNEIWSFFNSTL